MRKAAAVVLAIAGVGFALHLLPQSSKTGAGDVASFRSTTAGSAPTTSTAAPEPAAASRPARVFSLNQPLLAKPSPATDTAPAPRASIPSQLPAAAAVTPTLPTIAASSNSGRRLSSSRPADEDARRELVKDLQRELKRVGCYDGEINGAWTLGSRKAMTAFTERVNATLPLDEPDYILLTLVQGHTAQACGLGCPGGQGLNDAGKCVPRAVLAHSTKRHGDKAPAARTETPAVIARVAPAPRVSNPWSKVVTTTPHPPAAVALSAAQPAPLPGRMSIGAPVEVMTAAPDVASTKARRKSELAAAAAGALAPRPQPQPSMTSPFDEQALSDNAAIATTARNAISEGQAAVSARPPSPRPTNNAAGRITVGTVRPAYASQPVRWTRTIFNDITRMR